MADNKNIENFFKKRLESQKFAYREEDWFAMEKKLDTGMTSTPESNYFMSATKMLFISISAITVAFFSGWFLHGKLTNNKVNETQPVDITEVPESTEIMKKNTFNSSEIDDNLTGNPEIINQYLTEKRKTAIDTTHTKKSSETTNKKIEHQKNIPEDKADVIKNDTQKAISIIEQHVLYNNKKVKENNNNSGINSDGTKMVLDQPSFNSGKAIPDNFVQEDDRELINIPDNNNKNILPLMPGKYIIESKDNDEIIREKNDLFDLNSSSRFDVNQHSFLNRWILGISIAPDLTSVASQKITSATLRVGGHVYYTISNKWTVSVSAVYSNKRYDTKAEYYTPPDGYWIKSTNGIKPDNIIGSCKVVDIPVMVTYQIAQLPRSILYISAGTSNYILLDEKYDYEFNQYNPGAAKGWYTEENTPAPLSIVNLALGAETDYNEKLSISFHPFVKIPVKQVGWANVLLYSTGAQLTFKLNASK